MSIGLCDARFLRRLALCLFALWACADAAEARPAVRFGVLRWDNWNSGNLYDQVLSDKTEPERVPFYAQRLSDGALDFPGDTQSVLDADVHYAKSAGLDYFIFGYYQETGTWGRSVADARRLNKALHAYLALKDRLGIKFALNFNWSFPRREAHAIAAALIEALKSPDYVSADNGAAPVFFLVNSTDGWVKALGGAGDAAVALKEIRADVKTATGRDLHMVALMFHFDKNEPIAHAIGFDAVSTYATALGSGNREVPYAQCAGIAGRDWAYEARAGSTDFLPTVTMGWDYRPTLRNAHERATRNQTPDICAPASDAEWTAQIRAATRAAEANPRNAAFRSVVFYAWNEFSEGGWVEPTLGEGVRRLRVLAQAIGHKSSLPAFALQWPVGSKPAACAPGAEGTPVASAGAACGAAGEPNAWPCPPRMRVADDRWIAGEANDKGAQLWRRRACTPEP